MMNSFKLDNLIHPKYSKHYASNLHTHASIHCGPSAPSNAQPAMVPSIKSCLSAQSSISWQLPVLTMKAPAGFKMIDDMMLYNYIE